MSNSGLITKHETVEKGHFSLIYRKIPKVQCYSARYAGTVNYISFFFFKFRQCSL